MPNRRTETNTRAVLRTSSATADLQARARWGCNDARVATLALWMSREAFISWSISTPFSPSPRGVGLGYPQFLTGTEATDTGDILTASSNKI